MDKDSWFLVFAEANKLCYLKSRPFTNSVTSSIKQDYNQNQKFLNSSFETQESMA